MKADLPILEGILGNLVPCTQFVSQHSVPTIVIKLILSKSAMTIQSSIAHRRDLTKGDRTDIHESSQEHPHKRARLSASLVKTRMERTVGDPSYGGPGSNKARFSAMPCGPPITSLQPQ